MQSTFKYKYIKYDVSRNKWEGLAISSQTCDANFIKGNHKWVGFVPQSSGGGVLTLLLQSEPGRLPHDYPQLQCHGQATQDFEFMPYTSDHLATCSQDGQIKFWKLPENPKDMASVQPLSTMVGHQKKVNLLSFNPAAQGILASTGVDRSIRVFDVSTAAEVNTIIGSDKEYATAVEWNQNGSLLGTAWKDKLLRIFDSRNNKMVQDALGHEGSKPMKFSFMGDLPYVMSCGFNKNFEREMKLWDQRNLGTVLQQEKIDNSAGIIYPFYDADLGIMYMTGKGDGMIRYYEYSNGTLFNHKNNYQNANPGRTYSVLPKYGLDVENCEIGRFLKAGNNNTIEQIQMSQPKRATGVFYEEIYPPTAQAYAVNAADWINGQTSNPIKLSLHPQKRKTVWDFDPNLQSNIQASTSTQQQASKPSLFTQKPAVQQPVAQKPVVQQPVVQQPVVQQPVVQPVVQQPVVQQVVQQPVVQQPVVQQPVVQQPVVQQPVVQQVVQQPVVQQVVHHVEEPVVVHQPVQQPVQQPVHQPVQQPVQQIAQPTAQQTQQIAQQTQELQAKQQHLDAQQQHLEQQKQFFKQQEDLLKQRESFLQQQQEQQKYQSKIQEDQLKAKESQLASLESTLKQQLAQKDQLLAAAQQTQELAVKTALAEQEARIKQQNDSLIASYVQQDSQQKELLNQTQQQLVKQSSFHVELQSQLEQSKLSASQSAQLAQQLADAQRSEEALKHQVKSKADEVAQLQEAQQQLYTQLQEFQTNEEQLNANQVLLQTRNNEYSEQVQSLEAQIAQLHQQIEALKTEIHQLKEEISHHQSQSAASSANEETAQQLSQVTQQLADTTQQLTESHEENKQLRERLETVLSSSEQQEALINEVQATVSQQAQQIADSNARITQITEDYEAKLKELQDQLAAATQHHEQEHSHSHHEDNSQATVVNQALADELKAVQEQLDALTQQKTEVDNEKTFLAEQLDSLRESTEAELEHLRQNQKKQGYVFQDEYLPESDQGNNVLIVYAHPDPYSSYSAAQKQTLVESLEGTGHNVVVSDLYQDDFDPRLGFADQDYPHRKDTSTLDIIGEQQHALENGHTPDIVKRELARVQWANYVIFVAPIWWGSVPAILKGWFDRVLVPGAAYAMDGRFFGKALLTSKKAWLVTSTASGDSAYSHEQYQGCPISEKLHHITWSTFLFTGMEVIDIHNCDGVTQQTQEQRQEALNALREKASTIKDLSLLYKFGTDLSQNFGLILPYPGTHTHTHTNSTTTAQEHVESGDGLFQQIREQVEELKEVAQQIVEEEQQHVIVQEEEQQQVTDEEQHHAHQEEEEQQQIVQEEEQQVIVEEEEQQIVQEEEQQVEEI